MKINERFSYTESADLQGRTYYELWDNNRMHGQGALCSPICVATSYNLNEIIRRTEQ